MKTIIALAAFALSAAGCSASFSAGKASDKSSLDGKPTSGDDDMGKPIADNDSDRSGDAPDLGGDDPTQPKSELAAPPPNSAMKDGDCVPGKAKGHTKDKAQGEAKGHDKPPCPDEPGAEPAKDDGKGDLKSKSKTPDPKASDKAGDKAADKSAVKGK